jgi:hypothetical protein
VLHAIWLQAGLIGEVRGLAVMYAQSTDGGRSWSPPSLRAAQGSDWPRLAIASPDVVYMVWNQAATSANASVASLEVWGRFSTDSGQHWTDPKRIQGFDVTGPVDLVPDGAGGLFLIGLGQSANGGAMLIFSHWDGQAWSKPETADLGYDAASGNGVTAVFVPGSRRLEAALQAFTGLLGGAGQFRLMVTGRQVQVVPVVQPSPAPTVLPSPTAARTPMPLATATVGAASSLNVSNAVQPENPNPLPISNTIVAGVALIVLLVVGVVLFNLIRAARR